MKTEKQILDSPEIILPSDMFWAKIIGEARMYDGSPEMFRELVDRFKQDLKYEINHINATGLKEKEGEGIMKTEKIKTAEEILLEIFKKRSPELKTLKGFVYTTAILEAMEEYKNQPTEGLRLPTEEEIEIEAEKFADKVERRDGYFHGLNHGRKDGFIFGIEWLKEQIQSLN